MLPIREMHFFDDSGKLRAIYDIYDHMSPGDIAKIIIEQEEAGNTDYAYKQPKENL